MEPTTLPDAAYAALAEEIAAARDALIELANSAPDTWWDAYELKTRARNGWSAGALSLALNDLIEDGTFEVNEQRRVRLRK